jgi:hypothetical protein
VPVPPEKPHGRFSTTLDDEDLSTGALGLEISTLKRVETRKDADGDVSRN